MGACDNLNSPLSGNGNSFAIFWGLLLDGPFLFWVAFVFFFPQFLSWLTLAEFISACSVVEFAFRFEISVLNTFNLLAIATVWQHTLNDLHQTQDLLRHVTTCPFKRVSYSTGTGILMFFLLWQYYILEPSGPATILPFLLSNFDACLCISLQSCFQEQS